MIVLAWWLLLFGIWPFADPGHRTLEPLVVADLLLHAGAAAVLATRYWPLLHRPGVPCATCRQPVRKAWGSDTHPALFCSAHCQTTWLEA